MTALSELLPLMGRLADRTETVGGVDTCNSTLSNSLCFRDNLTAGCKQSFESSHVQEPL